MTRINFITNQPLERESGGWCGISRGLYKALARKAHVNFVGPIDPPVAMRQKLNSKVLRSIGLPGSFYFFSAERLEKISKNYGEMAPEADFDLFFGATSWSSCMPRQHYATFVDALFPTYMRVYGNPAHFKRNDLDRIRRKEECWLNRASHIFWTSEWAKHDALKCENLFSIPASVVGVGGNLDPPRTDSYVGEKRVLFVAMRFREKGGEKAFAAFESMYESLPGLKFVVIGERPPHHVSNHPGVEVLGLLDKRIPHDLMRLKSELSRALCLIHPTDMDMTPCILVEAAYWGCPVIAPARFGIPEMVEDKVTGLLLPDNFTIDDIRGALVRLLSDTADYKQMRIMARNRSAESFTYDVIAEKILTVVNQV